MPWMEESGFAFEKDMQWWKCSRDCSHEVMNIIWEGEEAQETQLCSWKVGDIEWRVRCCVLAASVHLGFRVCLWKSLRALLSYLGGRGVLGPRNTIHMHLITLHFLPIADQNQKWEYCNCHRTSCLAPSICLRGIILSGSCFQTISSLVVNDSEANHTAEFDKWPCLLSPDFNILALL